jgi:4-diphosphocytidyl-2-C-methyl-D-erythritol kinase
VGEIGPVIRIMAPAKLTLSLSVTGVRPDGYHELRAEMCALSLADELTFDEEGCGVTFEGGPGTRAESLAGEDNLVSRALAAVSRAAAVHVVKRIPLGGGLGGGSADAAAVLRWARCTDPAVALTLGSDVPFSVVGGRALVEGVGEVVTPRDFVSREFLLLLPPLGVDTRSVYAAWDALAEAKRDSSAPEGNALTAAALTVAPALARWRDALGDLAGVAPMLAGSGSTWFVEGGPPEAGTEALPWLDLGTQRALLLRARTVPAGWDGT